MRFFHFAVCVFMVCLVLGAFGWAQEDYQPLAAATSTASVPRLIRIRGALRDETGNALSGTVGITFTLYKDQSDPTVVWQEKQNVSLDQNGRYSVLLGATNEAGLPLEIFSAGEARWLGIRPDGQAEEPRTLFLSVAYALKAADSDMLGGKPASAFVLAENQTSAVVSAGAAASGNSNGGQVTILSSGAAPLLVSPQTACAAVTSDGTVGAGQIAMFNSACNIENSVIFQSGTNIGIGNTSPAGALDVSGTAFIRGLLTLPATGTATSSQGFNSNPLDLQASSFSSTSGSAVAQTFAWQAEPAGNNSSNPSGTLNLLFGSNGNSPAETGLSISSNGIVNFGSGAVLAPTGTATASQGFISSPLDLEASLFNSTLNKPVNYLFQWQAEPVGNDTTSTAASLNLLYGVSGSISETGLSIAKNGVITFASGQTFPGGGITQITAGPGLTGGGTSGNVTLSLIETCSTGQILSWNGTTWVCSSTSSTFSGTTNGIAYFSSSSSIASTAAPVNGQILIGSTGKAPVLSTLTAGSNISITNGAGAITISASGGGGGSPTLPFFVTGGDRTGGSQAATLNVTKLWGFLLPYNVTTTQVTYDVATADKTANDYDIGIFNNSGTLVVNIGATPGTTFAPSAGFKTLSWTQGSTSLPAGRYYLGFTTNCAATCTKIAGGATTISFAVNASAGASSGGALPASVTPPADSWNTGTQPSVVIH